MAEVLWMLTANCPSREEAKALGRALIERGLAQCVNVTAMMETLYMWEGALVEDAECRLLAKLPESRLDAAAALIQEMHSFEVPAIYGWPVPFASADYAAYLRETTA